MKKTAKFSLLIISQITLLTVFNCTKDSSTGSSLPSGQEKAIIFIENGLIYRGPLKTTRFEIPSTLQIHGTITSNELTEIKSITLNNLDITNLFDYHFDLGEVLFNNNSEINVESDTFEIEIENTQDIIKGDIIMPENIVGAIRDSISLGDSLLIDWGAVDADFYQIEMNYYYNNANGLIDRISLDTLLTETKLLLNNNEFIYDGFLFINIYPINGPFPEPGAISNMEGNGFLYSKNRGTIHLIQVGEGLPLPTLPKTNKSIPKNKIHDLILENKN